MVRETTFLPVSVQNGSFLSSSNKFTSGHLSINLISHYSLRILSFFLSYLPNCSGLHPSYLKCSSSPSIYKKVYTVYFLLKPYGFQRLPGFKTGTPIRTVNYVLMNHVRPLSLTCRLVHHLFLPSYLRAHVPLLSGPFEERNDTTGEQIILLPSILLKSES